MYKWAAYVYSLKILRGLYYYGGHEMSYMESRTSIPKKGARGDQLAVDGRVIEKVQKDTTFHG